MKDLDFTLNEELKCQVKFNMPLAAFTYYKIGGKAKYFIDVHNKAELFQAVKTAYKHDLPYFVIGGASNLLISDAGYDGLIIRLTGNEKKICGNEVTVFAGYNLGQFIRECLDEGLYGLEFAANIPGTVGGAIYGNAGAYGQGVGDFIKSVEVIKTEADEVSLEILSQEEMKFNYRDSIVKHYPWIIAEATFELSDQGSKQKSMEIIKQDSEKRCSSQPLNYPSCGCAFKNIEFDPKDHQHLLEFVVHDKIPAGKLIEAAGLKGKKVGQMQVSDKHANFLVNLGEATAADAVNLINMVKTTVKEKYKVDLQEEMQYLGF